MAAISQIDSIDIISGFRHHARGHHSQLSDETHRALKVRAAQHNRSTEAEMRAILEAAVRPEGRLRLGSALAEMSRKIGLSNADVEALEQTRDTTPAVPRRFE